MAPSFSVEIPLKVSPARVFQAGVVDQHKVIPQIVPDIVSGAFLVEGDGGVGTVRQLNFTEAITYKTYVKERIDVLDKENYEYQHTSVEGGEIGTKLTSATFHFKLVPAADGCVCKITGEFFPIPGGNFTEEDMNVDKEETIGMLKAVEQYLLATPDAYA